MSLGFYKFATVAGAVFNLSNTLVNIQQHRAIKSIEGKLSYIRDDISWIESNEINQLLSGQAALRAKYERDLAEFFYNKQQSLELDKAISALSTSPSFNDPKIYDIMLASIDNINLLLTSTSETLMQMFNINKDTLDKVLDLISEINSIKLKFNLDNANLQLKISDNSRLIIKLSEQQLAHQLSNLQNFKDLRDDLELINSQVDKKLADYGVLSTNTTGVILANGSFKLADTLNLVSTDIFNITMSEDIHNTSTSNANIYNSASVVSTIPYITTQMPNRPWACVTTSCNKLNLLTSVLIKKFSEKDHSGVGLLLDRPYKLLVSEINPQRELFLFLRGAGLSSFNENGLSVEFIPSLTKFSPITSTSVIRSYNHEFGTGRESMYNHSYGSPVIRNVTFGEAGSYKIPSSTQYVKIGSIFTASVIQKSDQLIVIKVKLSANYSSVLVSGNITGAVVSGSGVPSSSNRSIVTGGFFSIPSIGEVLAGGSFVINLPVNHLSFSGVECAQ